MNKNNKKQIISINSGKIYITASFNNTIITITDLNGNTLSWATAGSSGFKGTKKSTPFAAQSAMKKALVDVEKYQLKTVSVYVSGVGTGRDAAFRALSQSNMEILQIKDITPMAHNGPRAKKPRRV